MYLLFTPLFYINDSPHIGHYYNVFITKSFARLSMLFGTNHAIFTGTDEHGEKVYKSYLQYVVSKDLNQQQFVFKDYIEKRRDQFRPLFGYLNKYIEYNTDTNMHYLFVNKAFNVLKESGKVATGIYKGKYHIYDERYVTDSEYENMSESEKHSVEDKDEEGYVYKISEENKDKIINKIEKVLNGHFVDEIKSHIANINEIFISRTSKETIQHSIQIFGDPNKAFYVWFDAILYYVSVIKSYNYRVFNCRLFIGKDILKFHGIMLLSLLIDLDIDVNLEIIVHGLININNEKISKSKDNRQESDKIQEKYGDHLYSYLLTRNIHQDIEVNSDDVDNFIKFITNSVRNSYKRYYTLFGEYKVRVHNWLEILLRIFDVPEQIELEQIVKKLYMCLNDFNTSKIWEILVQVSNKINSMIDDNKFWEYDASKEKIFFVVGNYVRVCMLIEYIMCIPGAEKCLENINEPISSALAVIMKITDLQKNIDIQAFDL